MEYMSKDREILGYQKIGANVVCYILHYGQFVNTEDLTDIKTEEELVNSRQYEPVYSAFKDAKDLLVFDKDEDVFTKKELELAYCSGLFNQKDLTIDKLSDQLSNQKFPMILEYIKSLR